MENLVGGTDDDVFAFLDGGFVEGSVIGGLGNNTLDYFNLTTGVEVNLQGNTGTAIAVGFDQIQTIFGQAWRTMS